MTPARERLLRLALAMPEEGVDVIARTITWICPGLSDPMADIGQEAPDPTLRERVQRVLQKVQRRLPVPNVTPHDNVVVLFPAGQVRP